MRSSQSKFHHSSLPAFVGMIVDPCVALFTGGEPVSGVVEKRPRAALNMVNMRGVTEAARRSRSARYLAIGMLREVIRPE